MAFPARSDVARNDERFWLRMALAALVRPGEVFPLLRDDSDEAARARSEAVLALVLLTGIATVLWAPNVGRIMDDRFVQWDALLIAIVKARQWIDDLAHGRAASFAVIARREGKAERHIRLLAPLAFVSPRIVSALLDGTAPADLTLTKLARALPYCWAEQERRVGTSAPFHG